MKELVESSVITRNRLSSKIKDVRAVLPVLEDNHYKFVVSLLDDEEKKRLRKELFDALDNMDAVIEPAEGLLELMPCDDDDVVQRQNAEDAESNGDEEIAPNDLENDFVTGDEAGSRPI